MNSATATAKVIEYPIAVRDKDLRQQTSLVVEAYELCSQCGERFGIGHLGSSGQATRPEDDAELPEKLKEILCNDHRHNRNHKTVIELDG